MIYFNIFHFVHYPNALSNPKEVDRLIGFADNRVLEQSGIGKNPYRLELDD